jgi:TolB protein
MKKLNPIMPLIIALMVFACEKNENGGVAPPDPVTEPPYDEPVWHPSGEIIGFNHTPVKKIHYSSKGHQIYWEFDWDLTGFWLVNKDGTDMRRILPFSLNTPAWSPDGNWIAFSQEAQIFKMPFDGIQFDTNVIEQLTFEGRNFFPSWSPDGEWIVYDSNMNSPTGQYFIWKMKADGTSQKCIAYTPALGETRMPYWRNDFSIVHQRYIGKGTPEIFEMDSTGNKEFQLTDNNVIEMYPRSSPDYKYITYLSYSGSLTLHRIDVSTKETISLADSCVNYSWSPYGDKIVYIRFYYTYINETTGSLWTMDADGNNKQPLTYNNNYQILNSNY